MVVLVVLVLVAVVAAGEPGLGESPLVALPVLFAGPGQ